MIRDIRLFFAGALVSAGLSALLGSPESWVLDVLICYVLFELVRAGVSLLRRQLLASNLPWHYDTENDYSLTDIPSQEDHT